MVARHFNGQPALIGCCSFNEVHYTEADRGTLDELVRFSSVLMRATSLASTPSSWMYRRFIRAVQVEGHGLVDVPGERP